MSKHIAENKNRAERFAEFLEKLVEHNREEVRGLEKEPHRYLVAEYDSGDLNWMYTEDSLDEAEDAINAGSAKDVTVFDLDTGEEFSVSLVAHVNRG